MSTIELRHIINEHLSHIEDSAFLKAVKTIIETKASESIYNLSDNQKTRIDTARNQLKNGETISHEEVQNEINLWLSSK